MSVTTLAEFTEKGNGVEIGVPGFVSGETITMKIKRPSLMEMAVHGKIPNTLMATAASLFKSGTSECIDKLKDDDGKAFADFSEAVHCVVKAALVEPTYDELKERGIELTDVQLLYIYNYIQDGVDKLKGVIKKKN